MRPQQKHVAVSFLAISTHDLGANTSENLRRVAESQLLPPPIEGLMLLLLMPPLTPPPCTRMVWGHSLRSTFHRLHLLRLWTPTILSLVRDGTAKNHS
jgi:hypothetical protein